MTMQTEQLIDAIKEESIRFQGIHQEVSRVIVGNHEIIDFILIAILSDGHILLEGVPGVAKTTMVKSVASALGLDFARLQFTPDLLPADVIGTLIYNPKTQEFDTKKGPIFANIILADEINRSPAKVQSALLQAMQEHQVTIGNTTYDLPRPFLVFATQNPIEQEGTYQLPEAQLDRFIFKLIVTYPTPAQEREMIHRFTQVHAIQKMVGASEINAARSLIAQMYVDEKIIEYIVNIVGATREPAKFGCTRIKPYVQFGVSPRASLALYAASKAHAFLKKRHFVTPDDVKIVAAPILRHRLLLTYEAQAQDITADQIIDQILTHVACP
jgi:MoxR-like ATPase